MADKRPWFRVDTGYFDNPKVEPLVEENPRAIILHLAAIAYARRHLTDGVAPMRSALRDAYAEQCDVDALVSAGLVEVHETGSCGARGPVIVVHDYLEHQTAATDVEGAAERGRAAARARWNAASNADRSADPNTERESRESRESREKERGDVAALCDRLATRIEANSAKPVGAGAKWRDSARLLLDRDNRPLNEALRLIDWCQENDFWRSNVLSMPKFREKYDTLRLQAERDRGRPVSSWERAERNGSGPPPPAEPGHHESVEDWTARIAREQEAERVATEERRAMRLAAQAATHGE